MIIQDDSYELSDDRSKSNEYTDLKSNQNVKMAPVANNPVNTIRIGARKTTGRHLTQHDVLPQASVLYPNQTTEESPPKYPQKNHQIVEILSGNS